MSGPRSKQPFVFGLVASLVILVLSQALEWMINRELRRDVEEWTWISDVGLSAGLFVMAVLWIRLRQTREALSPLPALVEGLSDVNPNIVCHRLLLV